MPSQFDCFFFFKRVGGNGKQKQICFPVSFLLIHSAPRNICLFTALHLFLPAGRVFCARVVLQLSVMFGNICFCVCIYECGVIRARLFDFAAPGFFSPADASSGLMPDGF